MKFDQVTIHGFERCTLCGVAFGAGARLFAGVMPDNTAAVVDERCAPKLADIFTVTTYAGQREEIAGEDPHARL